MEVLVLSNKVPYPANDGSSIAMASIIDALVKNDANVTVFSINTKKHFKSDAAIARELPSAVKLHKIYHDTSVKPIGAITNLLTQKAYHVSRFYIKAYAKKLIQLLKENHFDVIQLEGLSMAVYIDLIRRYSKAKLVMRAHNVEHMIWERHIENEGNALKSSYLKVQTSRLSTFEKERLNLVDAIVPITPDDETIIREFLDRETPIYNLPCGIDLDKKKICNQTPKTDIAYLASFDWMPNVQGVNWFMDYVWPKVKEVRPETSFSLGGRHMPQHFQNFNQVGVSLHPNVESMREFICNARLIIVPLLAGSGMRIKIIENMSLGKCQVSTQVGAEGVKVESGQNIIIADEPEEFARSIVNLLQDDIQRQYVEREARETIEKHYSNRLLGQGLLSFYNTLIA